MRIDDIPFHDAKSVAQHYISGLPGNSWKTEQVFHCMRNLTAEISNDALASCANVFGLVAIETGGLNILFEFFLADRCEIFNAAIFAKKVFCYHVDTLVGTLSCELRGDEQLERICVVESAFCIWIQIR